MARTKFSRRWPKSRRIQRTRKLQQLSQLQASHARERWSKFHCAIVKLWYAAVCSLQRGEPWYQVLFLPLASCPFISLSAIQYFLSMLSACLKSQGCVPNPILSHQHSPRWTVSASCKMTSPASSSTFPPNGPCGSVKSHETC
jgi:hypothetical protein